MAGPIERIVTVGMNPAIDRIVELDRLIVGEHLPIRQRSRHAAGKAGNVSRALAALGLANLACGFIGREEAAWFARSLAGDSGLIEPRFTEVSGRTRECVTIVETSGGPATHLRDSGFTVRPDEIAALRATLVGLAGPGVLFCFSGSAPPGMARGDVAALVRAIQSRGALVAGDASGPALEALAGPPLLLIKPNRQELAELAGRNLDDDRALRQAMAGLAERHAHVLVSDGARGVYCLSGDRAWRAWAQVDPDAVVSTVGCGDCLMAGYVWGLLRDRGDEQALLRRAVAVATANAMTAETAAFAAESCRLRMDTVRVIPWT